VKPLPYVPDSRPGIVTACPPACPQAGRRFRPVEHRSTGLPLGNGLSRFGTVFSKIYWQALFAPFVVELFVVEGFARSPEPV
jgi:hypothetical protein